MIKRDGLYQLDLDGDRTAEVESVILQAAGKLEISDTGGERTCPDPGIYKHHISDDGTLRFTSVDDNCEGRRTTVAVVKWASRDQLNVYEWAIVDEPVEARS